MYERFIGWSYSRLRRCSPVLAASLSAALAGAGSGAHTWHVDDDACPGPGSGTPSDPLCSIQDAIGLAQPGDEILVAPGMYGEGLDLLGKAITVRSSAGAAVTIVDHTGLMAHGLRCASGESDATVVEGLTFASTGWAWDHVIIEHASPTLRDCVFVTSVRSNGIVLTGGQPVLDGCTIDGFLYSGLHASDASPVLIDCTVRSCGDPAMSFQGGSPSLVRVAFESNAGIGLHIVGTDAALVDCTFLNNGGLGLRNEDGSPTLTGCVFDGNAGGGMNSSIFAEPTLTACIFRNHPATAFTSWPVGGVYPSGFTMIDCRFESNVGSPWGGAISYSGNSAPVGTLESCEFVGNSASDAGGAISVHGGILVANDCLFEANTTSGSYSQGGGALYVAPGNWTSGSASISGSTFTSNGAADLGGAISLDGVLGDVGSGLYVTGTTFEGNHAPRGGAIATIAGGGAEIADCVFDANTAVIDGGALNFGGSNSLHVTGSTFTGNIAGERGGAVFDGAGPWGVPSTYSSCTFAQNEATAGGALALESDSFRIENSLIAMNASTDGAGLHVTGSILYQEVQDIVACRFIGNVATGLGGGVFVSASGPRIVSSLLTGNSAEIGGGLYNQDAAWTQVINATFAGNGALFGGGIGNLSSNPEVWNSILWGNTAAQGPQVRNIAGSAPLFAHSDVQGSGGSAGWNGSIGGDGGGNIEADPQFVDADGPDGQFGTSDDDVRLLPSSPCIDAASLAAHPSGFDTDVYGAPRLIDGDGDCAEAIDIGAAEEQSGGGAVDLHISAGSFASAVSAAGLVLTDLEDLSGHNGASQGYFALAPATDLNPGAPNVNPATQLGFPAGLAGTMGIGARDYQGAPLTLWVMPAAASGLPTDLVGNEIEAVGDNRDLVLWPAPGTLALGFDLHILQTNDTNECMIRVIEVDGCTVELNFVFATLPPYASFVGVRSDVGIERVEIDYAGVEAIANVQSWGIEITPPCPADISADGLVGLADLLAVLAAWGPCAVGAPCQGANVATDGTSAGAVDFADLLLVLTAWGTCPE